MTIRLLHSYETPEQKQANAARPFDFDRLLEDLEVTFEEYLVTDEGGEARIVKDGRAVDFPHSALSNKEPLWTDGHDALLARAGLVGCGWECGYPSEVRRA